VAEPLGFGKGLKPLLRDYIYPQAEACDYLFNKKEKFLVFLIDYIYYIKIGVRYEISGENIFCIFVRIYICQILLCSREEGVIRNSSDRFSSGYGV
jgi:hypothetical protein